MSEPSFLAIELPGSRDPVRVAVRRMRWFRAAFAAVTDHISRETGIIIKSDETALARCFVSWLRKVRQTNPHSDSTRRDFFDHAAGLMLCEMISKQPCRAASRPAQPDPENPAHFWPEGYCYTVFCMNVRAAAIQQEYGETASVGQAIHDLRTWWSFRENTTKNGANAVAFFKLLTGGRPNWQMPDGFRPDTAGPLPHANRAESDKTQTV